ncbi:GNAT family N-acetyltransferase [Bordetella bronchialis]|uniref:Acetyltransferase n=1 Tax=Bordetella bronchialis TaxID=463025 RepID=A0A193FM89_9BORD|nr:GNAT family N-acetyltransferase [Bordetella bronchialis]ANN68219.1 acetyltransferase [Bordetella bronchialis]ANN73351.1 acetyltransferase [Bordetella bronchialis]
MKLIDCTYERHAGAILDIFNDAILTSTALYEYQPRTDATMQAWFEAKRRGDFPVIGFEDDDGALMGFASYGTFRPFPAFKYSVEHSVYIGRDYRGRGLGEALMRALIERARMQQYHVLVAAIDSTNQVSCALHEKLGFVQAGTIRQAGYKFGRWLDVVFYQLMLETPARPVDG